MSEQTTKAKVALSLGVCFITAPLSYTIQRVLRSAGYLDGVSRLVGQWLAVHVPVATAGWIAGFLLFLVLYTGILWYLWRKRPVSAAPVVQPAYKRAPIARPAKPSDADGFEVIYRAHGKPEDIRLVLPPTTVRERERLVDEFGHLLVLARAGYDRAQKCSREYDHRITNIASVNAMAAGISNTLHEIIQTRDEIATAASASNCPDLLNRLSQGLSGSVSELQQKLTEMQRLSDVLLKEGTSCESAVTIMAKLRDEAHMAFQYVYDHMHVGSQALERLRGALGAKVVGSGTSAPG